MVNVRWLKYPKSVNEDPSAKVTTVVSLRCSTKYSASFLRNEGHVDTAMAINIDFIHCLLFFI